MRRSRQLAAGVAALGLGWLAAPHAPALYDGIGFPDEPYRYSLVLADDPVKTPPPTTATLTVRGPSNTTAQVASSQELGPQVSLVIPADGLQSQGSSTTLTATPEVPDTVQPADGPVAGDVYRVAVSPAGSWSISHPGTISLRSPQGTPYLPLLEHRTAGTTEWVALATTRTGNDIWTAPIDATGDYALVLPIHKSAAPMRSSHAGIDAIAGAVVAVALLLAGIRFRRRAKPGSVHPEPEPQPQL